ncbi:SNF2 family N-terminal domain-containing protein [Balamuthia mandrillaris]
MSTRAASTTNKTKRLAKRRNRPLQSNTTSSTTKVTPPQPKEGVNKENQKEQSSGLAKPEKTHTNKTTATTTSTTKQTKTTAIPSRTQQAAPPLSLKSQPRGAHSAPRKVIELLSSSSSEEESRISDDSSDCYTDFDSDSGSDSETVKMDMTSSTSAAQKHVTEEEDPEVEALNKHFAKMKSPSDHVSSSFKSQGRLPAAPVVAAASKQTTTTTAATKPKPNPVALFANKSSTLPTPFTSSTSSSMQHPTSVSHTAAVIPIFAATTNPKNIPRMSAAEIKAAVCAQNMAQLQQQQQKQQPKQQSELSLPSAHFSSASASASSASSFSVIPSTGVSDSLDSTDELEKVFERLQLSTTTFLEKKMQTVKKSSSKEEEDGDTEKEEEGEVEEENEEDDARLQPPRLKVTLLPHQRDALKWFLGNEAPESKVKGGILADDMGLGKTVQMISLMLANQPTDKVPEDQRGTLVVCTVSTLNQWYSELQERVRKGTFNVSIYHGSSKKRLQASLEEYDVVLTTYGTLAAEYVPSPDEKSKKKTAAKKTTTTRRRKKASPLYNMCWWRVILDEAHAIKNKDSKTAKATFALSARSRWCLTGTPIQNSLDDLWSLLHFLHLPDFETKDWWNQYILRAVKSNFKPTQDRGFLRLQTILKPLLLRRVKDQTYRGKPILDLPPVTHHVQLSEFEAEEKIFYDGIWEKAKLSFKNLMRGDAEMTYMQVLEWLLRLRQACDHPYLVLKGQAGQIGSSSSLTGNLNDDDDGDKFAFKEMDEYEFLNKEYKTALRIFNGMARKKQRQPKDHDDSSFVGLESMNEPRTPTKNTQLKLRDVVLSPSKKNPEASLHNICSLCQNALEEDAVCAPCRHQFCKECMDEWLEQNNSCPVCKISLKSAQLSSAGNMHCSPIPKGRPSFGGASTPMASTKIKALIAELVRLRPTGEKSIIFSQFTSYLDLVEVFLAKNGFKWTRLDGTMTQEQRADAIQTFKTKKDVNVFVVSLKAGGTGLNLTVASRVFLLDPWWNPCIDQQAIDRAHRLGQKRPVVVTRFLMKNSIEERIMELQEKKKALAQGALCPEKRESVSRLTIKDLKLLFRDF